MYQIQFNLAAALVTGITSLAVAFYFLSRKEKYTEDADGIHYETAIRSRMSIVEVKVPQICVGALIGSGGSVIKDIQHKTNTRINFKDRNPVNNRNTKTNNQAESTNSEEKSDPDRTLLIRGSKFDVQRAELEIKRILVDTPIHLTEEYYVPEYACGRIIGKCGQNIKKMQNMTGCRLKLCDNKMSNSSSGCASNGHKKSLSVSNELMLKCNHNNLDLGVASRSMSKPVMTIIGGFEQIQHAKELILNEIKDEEEFRLEKLKKSNNNFKNLKKSHTQQNNWPIHSKYSLSQLNKNSCDNLTKLDISDKNNNITDSNSCLVQEQTISRRPATPVTINLESYLDGNGLVDVYVSAVANPLAFWVRLTHNTSFKQLATDMKEFYTLNSDNDLYFCNDKIELPIESLVASVGSDGNWHRAQVKGFTVDSATQSDLVDIYFVDFGDSVYTTLDKIRVLSDQFYALPFQAVECAVDNIKLNEQLEYWSDESLYFFEDIVYSCKWKKLSLQLIKYVEDKYSEHMEPTSKPSVMLFDKTKNICIHHMLVEKGYASFTEEPANCEEETFFSRGISQNFSKLKDLMKKENTPILGVVGCEVAANEENRLEAESMHSLESEVLLSTVNDSSRCSFAKLNEFLKSNEIELYANKIAKEESLSIMVDYNDAEFVDVEFSAEIKDKI